MALSIGIVGLPNVGKSTLFNALTKAQNAQAANYPFCTIEPNKATVPVVDPRLDQLAALVKPQRILQTSIDFVDIAGLVRGASKGEGLGNQFLANIRECAAIVHVVRCFDDDNIVHVDAHVDPLRDIETVETELLLADIQSVEKRIERLQRLAKSDKEAKSALEDILALLEHLNTGHNASSFHAKHDVSLPHILELSLLSAKPIVYCANVDEEHVNTDNAHVQAVRQYAAARGAELLVMCARIEEELQGLPQEDQAELLASYGINESGLDQVVRKGYQTLGLISYFTAGEKEVRAWTIEKGWLAPQAAGVIHTDFERGFIRAEVIAFQDYIKHGSEAACRAVGLLRVEGKEYVVKDGDIVHFLFNV